MRNVSRAAGSYYWPRTRIRRRGMAVHRSIKMRGLLKKSALYLSVLFIFLLVYVWARVQVVETGYHLRSLEEEQDQAKEMNRSLLVEAAMLRSPQRLDQAAREMGLKRPSENRVYFLKK